MTTPQPKRGRSRSRFLVVVPHAAGVYRCETLNSRDYSATDLVALLRKQADFIERFFADETSQPPARVATPGKCSICGAMARGGRPAPACVRPPTDDAGAALPLEMRVFAGCTYRTEDETETPT